MSNLKIKFKNRHEAQRAICEAFVSLGTLAGIDVVGGKGPVDLDKDLISACYSSFYGDPHFLGGPACFIHAKSLAHVERIFTPALSSSERLFRYIEKRGDGEKVKIAEESIAVISSAHAWLRRIVTT